MQGGTAVAELVSRTSEGLLRLSEAGREEIAPWVTDAEGSVYAFTSESDPQAVSAAMARLSRNPNDLRTIIASEFMGEQGKDTALLRRVVNQFGDDSVMQLYPIQLVLEGVSNIATKEIEWGRLAAYLEQSTRYLRFDKKDEAGNYAYYTPEEFDDDTTELYAKHMDGIFDIYSELYEKLRQHIMDTSSEPEEKRDGAWRRACHAQACDGVRGLLPAATKATVGMAGSAQAVHNMILHLVSHELPEIRSLGEKALQAVRGVAPVFFERTDMPNRGGLISGHQKQTREATRELASRLLEGVEVKEEAGPRVDLISADSTEDELVAKILNDASSYPYAAVLDVVGGMSEAEKQEVIEVYVGDRYNRRAKPGRAFEWPHYSFEAVCDYGAFRDIQRHRIVDGLEWQSLQTGLGHETPAIIQQAGLGEEYEDAFALSRDLHDTLKERGYDDQAQYATLFGHLMRFTIKMNARSMTHTAELRTTSQGHPTYRKVYQDMHAAIAEAHPLIAKAMKFVSQDEDDELARLGAERYNQEKYGSDE
jgi:thymidylate synthase ThyX